MTDFTEIDAKLEALLKDVADCLRACADERAECLDGCEDDNRECRIACYRANSACVRKCRRHLDEMEQLLEQAIAAASQQ